MDTSPTEGNHPGRLYSILGEIPPVDEITRDNNYNFMLTRLNIPTNEALPRIKLLPLSNCFGEFITLCNAAAERIPERRRLDITGQFMMHAVIEDITVFGNTLPGRSLDDCLTWSPDGLRTKYRDKYLRHLQRPTGVPIETHLEHVSNRFPLFRFEEIAIGFLSDLMKILDPPVLLQLERGKLNGMTRAETQELKERIHFP